jgi:PAS domain S-box-containing protein
MAESPGRVLNVDDYVPARYARTQVLQRAGFEVIEASTGADALRIVAEERPDLVLLDVNLPDIDGFEVCRRLREQLGTLTVLVVHISSTFVNDRAQQLARDGGADAFLTEPVEPPVLLATVHALLRLRRAEEGLRAAGRRWQATFDAIQDGICLLTAEGSVVQCNAAFARLFGGSIQDVVGATWASLWRSFGPADADESLARLGQTRRRDTMDLSRDGEWFRLLVDPVVEGGQLAGVVGIVSDITIERQVTEARAALLAREQAAREEAEAANLAKDEFLAMLGHELRNPLDVVASAVHVLDAFGSEEPRAVHTRSIITQQVRQLARLVDELLDVSRVTTGKIALLRAPVDLAEIVAGCVRTLADSGHASQHVVRVQSASAWVSGDRSRLEQVVMNLLSNALKYTPAAGAVTVTVGGDGTTVRLTVKDSGAGIAPEVVGRIFDLFYQGRRTLDRAEGGLGIGLTLVRRLVELHGGRIAASSDGPGTGTTFTIELPQIPAVDPGPAPERIQEPARRRRILLVEDNPDSREMLKCLLELAGHDVHEAMSGPAGLDAILRLRPDVALVDLGLPGFDGLELARRVRASAGGDAVRLVALTGYGQPDDQRRSREAGFDAHLVKPADPARLASVIAGSRHG